MDNTTEEKNTQTCTPDEAYCCDTAAEQAPVTQEELQKAIDHVMDLVGRYDGHVAVAALLEDEARPNRMFRASSAVFMSDKVDTKIYVWVGAFGYFLRANECFDLDAKAIGEGVRFFLEAQQKERTKKLLNPIASVLGIAGCECEECQD